MSVTRSAVPTICGSYHRYFFNSWKTRLPDNETQFLLSVEEFYGLVASYNRYYVLDPFRRMSTTVNILLVTAILSLAAALVQLLAVALPLRFKKI